MRESQEGLLDLAVVRFGLGVGVLFAAVACCERAGADVVHGGVVLGAVCVIAALGLPLRLAVATGLVGWAVLTGFLVNVGGQLTFDAADLARAAVLVLVTASPTVVESR